MLDFDAEVGAALPNGIASPLNVERIVLLGVAGDDVPAAPADQLVDAEVLEVAAVGEVDEVRRSLVPNSSLEQIDQAEARARRIQSGRADCPSTSPAAR